MPRHLQVVDVLSSLADVTKGPTPPASPELDDVWLATSVSPPVWRVWADDGDGPEWVDFGGGASGGGGASCDLFGDGSTTTFDVAHELGTSCLLVEVSEVASGDALVHGTDYSWLILDDDTIRVVFAVAPANEDVRIVVAAGAAGGSADVPAWVSHLASPDGPSTFAEEFDGEAFDAGWVEVETSGECIWTQARGVASARFHSQGNAATCSILFPYAVPVGHTVETFLRVLGVQANHLMAGPIVAEGTDASSACVYLMPYTSTNFSLRGGTLGNIATTLREAVFDLLRRGEMYLRLTHVSANTWRAEGSPDGVSWTNFSLADVGFTCSPTHVGLAVTAWGGGASPRIASFEYVRVHELA